MLIVLTGIDGSGKTTAARALVAATRQRGETALLLSNYAGRRRMSVLGNRLGLTFHPRFADTVETFIRTINVLVSHLRAHRYRGLVVMDRHLYCQLALRAARRLPRGRLLPWILRLLPDPDVVVHFLIDPEQAHARVLARGTDSESLRDLSTLDAAYRSLPEFSGFTEISASSTPAVTLSQLRQVMETRSPRLPALALPVLAADVG